MNPTDEVDDLLTRAGARWRADQPSAPEPDLDQIVNGRRRPRRWVPALAAASVAAIAAAALTVLPDGTPKPTATPATSEIPQSFAQGNQTANDDLLVHNGDRVEVSGEVIAAPGQDPVFCAPHAVTLIGYLPGKEPAPSCPADLSVTLKGLDLTRLTNPLVRKDVRTGSARIVGVWTDRTIAVQEVTAPSKEVATPLPPVPCAPPAGGWKSKPSNIASPAVTAFLDTHADQVAGPITQYPNGYSRNAPVVITVGVTHGDLAAFQTAFEQVYDGNLCVTSALVSQSESERISKFFENLGDRPELGLSQTGGSGADFGPAPVTMLVYTEAVKTALAPVGLDLLKINTSVKPAR